MDSNETRRNQTMKMAADLMSKFAKESEIAVGQRIGISQQLLNKAKKYGEASDNTYELIDAAWRKYGLGPPMEFEVAAQFARVCKVGDEVIDELSSWDWSDTSDPMKMLLSLIAERDRRLAQPKPITKTDADASEDKQGVS